MTSILLLWLVFTWVSGSGLFSTATEEMNRDKTGTARGQVLERMPQAVYQQTFTKRFSFEAERGGFEPPVQLPAHGISSAAQSAALAPLLVGVNGISQSPSA